MKLKILKQINYFKTYNPGEIIEYKPWDYVWQGLTEPERVARGIFVYCFGHGDFIAFKVSEGDVEIVED